MERYFDKFFQTDNVDWTKESLDAFMADLIKFVPVAWPEGCSEARKDVSYKLHYISISLSFPTPYTGTRTLTRIFVCELELLSSVQRFCMVWGPNGQCAP